MKKDMPEQMMKRMCPVCGCSYTGHPAISRNDAELLICPDCGIREALESIGIAKDEQEQILNTIHSAAKA